MERFEGKVAFITGGGAGLGEGVAVRLSSEGARIVIADVDPVAGERVASSLPDAIAIETDTSEPAAVEAAFAQALDHYGSVDVVHNNAGITGLQQSVVDTTVENWNNVMAVNASGVFYVLKWGLEAMLKGGGGSMVITSSSAALAAQQNITPYTFAKAGIMGITRSAAIEYADRGIRVNAIAPTAVLTPMVETFIEASEDPVAFRKERETWNPIPGWPYAEDIAAVVAFLASDDAKWITGVTLAIDGGYTAR
jgi:NAD(P)-dependent dehydrogenase (short-subunit alcohol dehydrogenase family)